MTIRCHDCGTTHEALSAWDAPTRCGYCRSTRLVEERPLPRARLVPTRELTEETLTCAG